MFVMCSLIYKFAIDLGDVELIGFAILHKAELHIPYCQQTIAKCVCIANVTYKYLLKGKWSTGRVLLLFFNCSVMDEVFKYLYVVIS